MRIGWSIAVPGAVVAAQPISAQTAQPSAMMLAQAHDRCMTTYAVRLTNTAATDQSIFADATAGCKELKDQLGAAIARDYTPAQATELNAMLEAQAKPNFDKLLQRIRADRAAKPAN
ncbi:hypothetical protein ACFQPG_02050 [Sphingomonas sp. GCM10030256]|uniref:hypothetical protein n=1 Tax=Sphingomonas sp. GCM10030256 TaxID=3273427 RepID=UPI00360ECE51